MKRDMDLIRAILLHVEEHDEFDTYRDRGLFPTHDERSLNDHVLQMKEQGLVDANIQKGGTVAIIAAEVTRLTPQGHDFLQAARNETIWRRAKAIVAEKGGSVPWDVFKALLVAVAKDSVGLK